MKVKAELSGREINGLSYSQFVEKGKEWVKEKEALGWKRTCAGLLSPEDIKKSGMKFSNTLEEVWDWDENKMVKKAMGYNTIPSEEYIIENGPERGQKHVSASRQFMAWEKEYKAKLGGREGYEDQINKEATQQEQYHNINSNEKIPEGIRVEDIPF